ncbi:MAG: polysaccharide deacetylase family protein [Bacteroidetes bacterium]|nr:polysaccharide deacetylase family protein [Bacteroidota bacterium]
MPESFYEERSYVAGVIFKEFLGLGNRIQASPELTDSYIISMGGKRIVITDDFFCRYSEPDGYLGMDGIPKSVRYLSNSFLAGKDTPVFFGGEHLTKNEKEIVCGIDIFSMVFFMLTRWEECVIGDRDYLLRFPAEASLAFKSDFLHRPVVNEWIAMLANMMRFLWPGLVISPRERYGVVFTHDIDLMSKPVALREFAKDILKRKSLSAFSKRLGYLFAAGNPYDVFDYFMDVSEKHNTTSRFYFMTGHQVPYRDGEPYNGKPIYRRALQRIKERGHVTGFHPSLNTYNDAGLFLAQKNQLEMDCGTAIVEGRQHALRFELPLTWRIWEGAGMRVDGTLGYSSREGFRCGTGNSFPVFDVVERRQLQLREQPLVVMDTTLHVNRRLSVEASGDVFRHYMETGKRYDMPVTLLFHNLLHDTIDWQGWGSLYSELFE